MELAKYILAYVIIHVCIFYQSFFNGYNGIRHKKMKLFGHYGQIIEIKGTAAYIWGFVSIITGILVSIYFTYGLFLMIR